MTITEINHNLAINKEDVKKSEYLEEVISPKKDKKLITANTLAKADKTIAAIKTKVDFDPLLNHQDVAISHSVGIMDKAIEFIPHKGGMDDLVDIMYEVADKVSKIGQQSELTDIDKKERDNYRLSLANYIRDEIDIKTLKTSLVYGGEKMSFLELATKLNLGPDVVAAILDKAELHKAMFTKSEIDNAHKNIQQYRNTEKLSNYMEAVGEIGGMVGTGTATGLLGGPVAMAMGAGIGLVVGATAVATTKIGETTAKDTKKLLGKYSEKLETLSKVTAQPTPLYIEDASSVEMQPLSKRKTASKDQSRQQ